MTDIRTARGGARPRPQLSDEAAAWIRDLVMSGGLTPGDPVRAEDVARSLDISQTPAREALQLLRAEGFLTLTPRRGFQVAALTGDDIRDLYLVQSFVAGELAARAAERISDADLTELERINDVISGLGDAAEQELETHNHEFHRLLNLAAGSTRIAWVLGLMTRYVPRRFYARIDGWPRATVEDHRRVLEGIRARDPERARRAMQDHVRHAGELLAENFDKRVRETAAPDTEKRKRTG
jgi:DNA-binding GntR family transcriptional regulator